MWIPLDLKPGFAKGSGALPMVPGIALQMISDEERESFTQKMSGFPFVPTAMIRVDAEEYEAGAKARLEPKGLYQSMLLPPLEIDDAKVDVGTFAGGVPIAKWALTALVLCRPFSFRFGPVLRTYRDGSGAWETPAAVHGRPIEMVPPFRAMAFPPEQTGKFNAAEFEFAATAIEEYYRPVGFRMDRLAVALSSLWTSLCTWYPEQSYTSLSIAMEALLSTQESEITHQLAERTAVLLGSDEEPPITLYRAVKRLYDTRSNIVHGRGMSKDDQRRLAKRARKKQTSKRTDYSLHIHPMMTLLPLEQLQQFTGICIRLIRSAVAIPELLALIQTHDDNGLDRFFTELLLGSETADDESLAPSQAEQASPADGRKQD